MRIGGSGWTGMTSHGPLVRLSLAALLAGVLASPALAGSDAVKAQIEALKRQIAEQQKTIEAQQQILETLEAQVQDVKREGAADAQEARRIAAESPKLTIKDARPTFETGDGKNSISLRGRMTLDLAKYVQGEAGPQATDFRRGSFGDATEAARARDLNDGANFRRAQIGIDGKLLQDWAYSLIYEFGGSGQEDGGRIQDLYLQYNGFEPFRFRIGAFSPSANYDDSISNADSLFLERATPAELSRQIAGGEGRTGVSAYANGEEWYASLALTGAPIATQSFDEQLALVGRVAFLPVKSPDFNVHVGANSSYVFQPGDQGPDVTASARFPLRLRDRPEIRVDGTRLIDTGNINSGAYWSPGVELAANFYNFYVQAEHTWYRFERKQTAGPTLPDPDFRGWYVAAAYALTGETRNWNPSGGVFSSLKPANPLTFDGDGFGAWEIALRYSSADLNYRTDLPVAAGGIFGGEQSAWTVGLNWYVNNNIRFLLDYQWLEIDRLSTGVANAYGTGVVTPPAGAQIGQDVQIISLRTQFTF